MYKVDSKERTREIFSILETGLASFKKIGKRKWGNPSGVQQALDVYEIMHGEDIIWVSTIEWCNASSGEINRCGIISTLPDNSNNTLGQILEVNMPYYFSKSFNTRVYEGKNSIEIRNYGKFTIGRRGLKRQYFFDYLRNNGEDKEICIDEDGKEYICIIKIEDDNIESQYIGQRLTKWTIVLKKFKDYYRKFYNSERRYNYGI